MKRIRILISVIILAALLTIGVSQAWGTADGRVGGWSESGEFSDPYPPVYIPFIAKSMPTPSPTPTPTPVPYPGP